MITWYLETEILQVLLISKSKDIFHDFELCWFYVVIL